MQQMIITECEVFCPQKTMLVSLDKFKTVKLYCGKWQSPAVYKSERINNAVHAEKKMKGICGYPRRTRPKASSRPIRESAFTLSLFWNKPKFWQLIGWPLQKNVCQFRPKYRLIMTIIVNHCKPTDATCYTVTKNDAKFQHKIHI